MHDTIDASNLSEAVMVAWAEEEFQELFLEIFDFLGCMYFLHRMGSMTGPTTTRQRVVDFLSWSTPEECRSYFSIWLRKQASRGRTISPGCNAWIRCYFPTTGSVPDQSL